MNAQSPNDKPWPLIGFRRLMSDGLERPAMDWSAGCRLPTLFVFERDFAKIAFEYLRLKVHQFLKQTGLPDLLLQGDPAGFSFLKKMFMAGEGVGVHFVEISVDAAG